MSRDRCPARPRPRRSSRPHRDNDVCPRVVPCHVGVPSGQVRSITAVTSPDVSSVAAPMSVPRMGSGPRSGPAAAGPRGTRSRSVPWQVGSRVEPASAMVLRRSHAFGRRKGMRIGHAGTDGIEIRVVRDQQQPGPASARPRGRRGFTRCSPLVPAGSHAAPNGGRQPDGFVAPWPALRRDLRSTRYRRRLR